MSRDKDDTQSSSDSDEDKKSSDPTGSSPESEENGEFMIEETTMEFGDSPDSDVAPETGVTTDDDSNRLNFGVEDMLRKEDKASGSSRDLTDKDSRKPDYDVKDNRTCDMSKCSTISSEHIPLSIDLQRSTLQNVSKQSDKSCVSTTEAKQTGFHREEQYTGIPTKRRFPFSSENSAAHPDVKKRTVSTSPERNPDEHKSTECNIPFVPAVTTPAKLKEEFSKTADEEYEKVQHTTQRTEFYSQSSTRQKDASGLDFGSDRPVHTYRETKIPSTDTKPEFRPSHGNLESQSDFEKHATSIEPDEKAKRDSSVTATKLNLPPSFLSENFEKQFSKVSKENLHNSSKHAKPFSQSPPKQIDDSSSIKVPETHQQSESPLKRRLISWEKDSKSQPDLQKRATKPDGKVKDSRIKFIGPLVPPTEKMFSPQIFAEKFAKNSDTEEENSQHSLQQPKRFSQNPTSQCPQKQIGDPRLPKQAAIYHDDQVPGPSSQPDCTCEWNFQSDSEDAQKTDEKSGKDSKGTTNIFSNLPTSGCIFSTERFREKFTKTTTSSRSPQKQVRLDSARQSDTHQGDTSGTPKKRRFSPESLPRPKKRTAYTKPVAKVTGNVRTTDSTELITLSSSELENILRVVDELCRNIADKFPEQFGLQCIGQQSQSKLEKTLRNVGEWSRSMIDQLRELRGLQSINQQPPGRPVTTSPFIVRFQNPALNCPFHSQLDSGDNGSSHAQSSIAERPFDNPAATGDASAESHAREINLLEMSRILEERIRENLASRTALIATRLRGLQASTGALNTMLEDVLSEQTRLSPKTLPPSERQETLQERRASAREYHRRSIAERQRLLFRIPVTQILFEHLIVLVGAVDDIRDGLSVGSYDSTAIKNLLRTHRARLEHSLARFRQNVHGFEEEKRMHKHYAKLKKISNCKRNCRCRHCEVYAEIMLRLSAVDKDSKEIGRIFSMILQEIEELFKDL